MLVLLSPYAPHLAEELWSAMGLPDGTCALQAFPLFDESILQESTYDYPISFNGKMRFKQTFDLSLNEKEIVDFIVALPLTQKYLEGKTPKKVIVVQGKIVNIVS